MYLKQLSLDGNLLHGTIHHWIYSLKFLQVLSLAENQFTGQIEELKSHSLQELVLGNNKLHGPIPRSTFFQPVNLVWLDLSSNNLSGGVGLQELARLQNLEILHLSFNNLSLSSAIFHNLTMPRLVLLFLPSCNITKFPNFIRNFKNLRQLDISFNHIAGTLPNWLWNNSLHYVDLSHNFLTMALQFA